MSIKTTVYLDSDAYRRLQVVARREGRSTAALVREAVSAYAARKGGRVRPKSVGAGHSGRGDLSVRAESLLKGMGQR